MAVVTRRMTLLLLAFALVSPKLCAAEPPPRPRSTSRRASAPSDFAEVTIELECGGTMQVRDDNKAPRAKSAQRCR